MSKITAYILRIPQMILILLRKGEIYIKHPIYNSLNTIKKNFRKRYSFKFDTLFLTMYHI